MSKTLEVVGVPGHALVEIKWSGGGEVPDDLKGYFTSIGTAQARIKEWYARNPHRDPSVEQPPRGPGRPRKED